MKSKRVQIHESDFKSFDRLIDAGVAPNGNELIRKAVHEFVKRENAMLDQVFEQICGSFKGQFQTDTEVSL